MEEDVGGKGHENGLNKHQRVMGGAGQVRNVSGVGATYPMLEAENAGVWKAESSMSRSKYRFFFNVDFIYPRPLYIHTVSPGLLLGELPE